MTKTKMSNEFPSPTHNGEPAHRSNNAENTCEDEALATEQGRLKKRRKDSTERSRRYGNKKYQERTERWERGAKRGRSKSRHEDERGDEGGAEGGAEGGGPFGSCITSSRMSHRTSATFPVRTPSRGLSRSRSSVSRLNRKDKEVCKNDERRQYVEKTIDKTLQPTQGMVKVWRIVRRTARIVSDGVSSALRLFVAYFLKYLVIFLILVLFVSITHRAICEIPLVRYFHPPCTAVWAPTPLLTDSQQDYALSQLAEPMLRHTEYLNQLQENEYFETLPMALFQSLRWMRGMKAVLEVTSLEIPSREKTVEAIREYVIKAEETGENLSKLWAKIPSVVHLVLLERKDLMKGLEKIHSTANDNNALTSALDIPGLLWSFVATSLLGVRVLTPFQGRQVDEEQARLRLLRSSFSYIYGLLTELADDIKSAQQNFENLNSNVYKIQSLLFLDISKVSSSRDLLSLAEAHPYQRFRALLGLRVKEGLDLRSREAQLELLSTTNSTVTITIRELTVMADVVRKLRNDMDTMLETLNRYETSLGEGKISVDGLLRAVKVGIEALARGRVSHLEREKMLREKRSQESDKRMAEAAMGLRNVVDQFHKLVIKQVANKRHK